MTPSPPSVPRSSGRTAGRHFKQRQRATAWRRLWPVLSVVAVLAGLALLGNIGRFYLHSHTAGSALIHRQQALDAKDRAGSKRRGLGGSAGCTTPAPSASGPRGLLEASSIGLQAPVVAGVGDAQLAEAVGHVPASAWPGPIGTTVLSAHDVSWFSHIDHLAPGAQVRYVTPCTTYLYTVTGHQIVKTGSPIYNTASPRLVMVTCYPLDALFLTPDRYVVDADLTQVVSGGHIAALPPATTGALTTSLPSALASSVAAKVTTTAPLGQLTTTGTPTPAWSQSLAQIDAGGSVLTEYFGAVDVAQQANSGEWAQVAPGVPLADAGPLQGASITSYPSPVDPTIVVSGTTVTSAQVLATIDISGGSAPGTYQLTMTATTDQGRLTVTGWSMIRT